jgi:hypothetical protein
MFALSYRPVNSSSGIGRLNLVNCKCFRLSFAMKTDKPLVSVFMLTQALAMGVTNGRQTPRPPETPINPLSASCGQRRLPLRSGWTPSLPVTWGNDSAERCAKTPKSKEAHRHELRATNPFKTRVSPVYSFSRARSEKRERCFKGVGRA